MKGSFIMVIYAEKKSYMLTSIYQKYKEAGVTIRPVRSVVVGPWLSCGWSFLSILLTLLHHMTNSVRHHLRCDGALKKKRRMR